MVSIEPLLWPFIFFASEAEYALKPRAISWPILLRNKTASPWAKFPVIRVIPAGRRLFPLLRASAAPLSTVISPLVYTIPAIHLLRAFRGEEWALNQVARPPRINIDRGSIHFPLVITMSQPLSIAMLAASSFVIMPPDE